MSTQTKNAAIGFKVDEEVKSDLKDLAHERRTTLSDLLRGEVHDLLENADEIDD